MPSTKAVSSPSSSTPTSPPPMITNVRSCALRRGSVSTSARSNRSMTWLRSSRASARVLNVKACSEPGIMSRLVLDPRARTSWS